MTPAGRSRAHAPPLHPVASPRPVRVCHVMSADLWAGAEVQVATVASYLVRREDVEMTAVLLNEGRLARELRRLGVPVTVIHEGLNGGLRILLALVRLLRSRPVEIVHTHRYKDTVLGAIAAKLAGVPRVVRTVHGRTEPMRGWASVKFRAYEAIDRLALRCLADRIVAVSRSVARWLEESGFPPGTVVPIRNGVDLGQVRPARGRDEVRRELGIDPGTPLIGTVGRLSPVKGHRHFVRAAGLLLRERPEARFLVVGDGPLRGELQASARRLPVDRACAFLGPRPDVYDLLAAMDVFVLPSLDEGTPMALLEAMALGRPVVASAVGGVPEIVTHRVNGLLVEPGDERGLAEACRELITERGWAERLGARARRSVEEGFSHVGSGRDLVEVYRAIGAGEGRARGRPPARGGAFARAARRVSRRAACLVEARRASRVRRDPRVLLAALRAARRVLVVCHGNIIRSPFAAALLAQGLGAAPGVSIASAGLAARPGTPPPPPAVAAAAAFRVDVSGHRASTVTREAVAASNVIFVMEVAQLAEMGRRFPEARARTFLLTCLAPDRPLEVRDPVGGVEAQYQASFDHIAGSVLPILGRLARVPRDAEGG